MSVVTHMQSKLLGGMRTQFKAALLPTGEVSAEKRKREGEEGGEEPEQGKGKGAKERTQAPPHKATTLKQRGYQKMLGHLFE